MPFFGYDHYHSGMRPRGYDRKFYENVSSVFSSGQKKANLMLEIIRK